MAKDHSFDVVSEVDMQEVDNAVQQAKKELDQRFDFKGSNSSIELDKDWGYLPAKSGEVAEINRRIMRRSETLVSNDKALLEKQIDRIKTFLTKQK